MSLIDEIDKAAQLNCEKTILKKIRGGKDILKTKVTICFECQNFTGNKSGFWERFCKAAPRKKVIDYVTGKGAFSGTNDIGGAYTTEEKYQHCHHLNYGKCQNFQAIEKSKPTVTKIQKV